MKLYKTLDVHTKINAKECFILLCGVKWEDICPILGMKTMLNLMEEKLKSEGIEI